MEKKPQIAWWQPGVTLFGQMAAWIVVPIITAIYFGRWLDDRYNSAPWFFFICVGIAFVITNVGIFFQAMKSLKQIKKLEQDEIIKKK